MKTALLSLFTLVLFVGNSAKITFEEELNMVLPYETAYHKATEYIIGLPKVDKLLNNKITGSREEKFIESSRSFIAYKYNKLFKQPKAEVHYQVRVDFSEGSYSYQFSNFKVYTYKRNRYGVFARSSSKSFELEKLSSMKQKELKALIALEINKYAAGLKNALAL